MSDDAGWMKPGFGLRVQPMVHVEAMADAMDFYEAIGGAVLFGSRDSD